ncbi:Calcium-binding EF-hand [Corchorus capsularis]|uniref:Calcium-binding EF-hand n=1 Tax=Corchorus capsularis TaxID=210143 RepID=A0A1R3HR15_COCAP|nr:Calcium-binding EF-hand [Corchorus capsularis]
MALSAETETLSHVLTLVEAFRAFDADNDGAINAAELGGILSSLGYNASEPDVRAMMQQGDANKDGLLSIQEFLHMNTRDMELAAVTAAELYQIMGNLGVDFSLEDCQGVIASMDADGDGAVSFDDFKLIVNSLL